MTKSKRKDKGSATDTKPTDIDDNTKKKAIQQWKEHLAKQIKEFKCKDCNLKVSTSNPALKETEKCYDCALKEYLGLKKAKA